LESNFVFGKHFGSSVEKFWPNFQNCFLLSRGPFCGNKVFAKEKFDPFSSLIDWKKARDSGRTVWQDGKTAILVSTESQ